tara:strand:+ start:577 stop:870 length:294 start_codon:yes stop_codon:yes gene_type:complete
MDDEFNIDDFLGDPDFERKMEEYREQMIHEAILDNFNNIKNNGISPWHLRHMSLEEITQLKETFQYMTKHFIDLEEYEKCAVLAAEVTKLEDIIEKV